MEYPPVIYDSLKYYADVGFLCDGWLEPHRKYHGMNHLATLLSYIPDLKEFYNLNRDQVVALHYMAWFHDAVYDPERKDNEALSAELAESFFDGYYGAYSCTYADIVIPTIIGTAGHKDVHYFLQGLFYDMDLAGLGSDYEVYEVNESMIREEYKMFSDQQWEAGRQAFLEDFLTRETIFHTSWGAQFEEQARKNMMAELALLRNAEWPWETPKPVETKTETWINTGSTVYKLGVPPMTIPTVTLPNVTYSLGNSTTTGTPSLVTGSLGNLGSFTTYSQMPNSILDTFPDPVGDDADPVIEDILKEANTKYEDKPKKKKKKAGKKRS